MWELLIEPTKIFIKGGINAFQKNTETRNLSIAIRDKIRRELKFNNEIINNINNIERSENYNTEQRNELKISFIKKLKTSAFESIENGIIPLNAFFPGEIDQDIWPSQWADKKTYMEYVKNIKNKEELVERIYFRIELAKARTDCNQSPGDLNYINFLISACYKELDNLDSNQLSK